MNIQKRLCLGTVPILVLFLSFQCVSGQKTPTALEQNSKTSPTSVAQYRELALLYKNNPNPTPDRRNQLIFLAVAEIDVNFRHYQRKRRIGKDLFHVVMDILQIGAATAIGITNGERAKSIIGESLAFVQGARASADKNLRLLEMQILFNKMIERRATVMNEILQRSALSVEQYPFERAYIDIVAYYNAGTWDTALSMLATDTGASAQAAEALLAARRNVGLDIAPTAAELRAGAQNIERISTYFLGHRELQTALDEENRKPSPSDDKVKEIEGKQQTLLLKLRSIVGLIEGDAKLRPILYQTPDQIGLTAAEKSSLQQSLLKVRDITLIPSVSDYERVLRAFVSYSIEMSARDTAIIERVANILKAVN